jgi:hypothetical protein
LSARRCIRAVDATTVEEQGGAGTDWRVHYTLRLRSALDPVGLSFPAIHGRRLS